MTRKQCCRSCSTQYQRRPFHPMRYTLNPKYPLRKSRPFHSNPSLRCRSRANPSKPPRWYRNRPYLRKSLCIRHPVRCWYKYFRRRSNRCRSSAPASVQMSVQASAQASANPFGRASVQELPLVSASPFERASVRELPPASASPFGWVLVQELPPASATQFGQASVQESVTPFA